MGKILFGGTEIERIQFNQISLWNGHPAQVIVVHPRAVEPGAVLVSLL